MFPRIIVSLLKRVDFFRFYKGKSGRYPYIQNIEKQDKQHVPTPKIITDYGNSKIANKLRYFRLWIHFNLLASIREISNLGLCFKAVAKAFKASGFLPRDA